VDGRAGRSTWIYRSRRNLWRESISHNNVAGSIDMSDVDRGKVWQLRCGHKALACSVFAHLANCHPAIFEPGRADPDPSGSSRISASLGQVDA